MNDDILDTPLARLTRQLFDDKDEINRTHRGRSRKVRLMLADLAYGLAVLEGELGDESLRQSWAEHADRLWCCRRAEHTAARAHLLAAIAWADESLSRWRVQGCWANPRTRERRFLATGADGVEHFRVMELPSLADAAEEGMVVLRRRDPDLASLVSVGDIAAILPVWKDRQQNTGRRGKTQRIDGELCKLIKRLGYGPVSSEAMRRQRIAWEKTWPRRRTLGAGRPRDEVGTAETTPTDLISR